VTKQTKPEIALSLLDQAQVWGLPIQTVVVDSGYGDNPNFLAALDVRQIPYMCAVESTFGVRLPHEVQAAASVVPAYQGRGQPCKPRCAPRYAVKELIEALPGSAWQTIEWRQGTRGTMRTQVVALRVHWGTGTQRHSTSHSRVQTGPEGWLLAERPLPGKEAEAEPVPLTRGKKKKQKEKQKDPTKYWCEHTAA